MVEGHVLKILFIEDMPEDLELAKRKIKSSGIEFESYLAETEDEFLKGLYEFKPDIIISDYLLPGFDGMKALELALTYDAAIPFIILTGAANEEIVVDAMKTGANDYILKERINRLPFAIQEAMEKKNALIKTKKATESLEYLSQIIEQSPYTIISTDMDGIITSWNKGAEIMYKYPEKEILGQNISILYPEKDYSILQEKVIDPLIENGQNYQEIRLKRKDGTMFIGALSLWLLKNRSGQPMGMVGYTRDITKEKKAEEELRIKGQAIEYSIDGISMMNLEGRVTYANQSTLKMWGYTKKEEVIGRRLEDFWCNKQKASDLLKNMDIQGIKDELLALKKDGTTFPVWVSATVIKDMNNNPIAYMGSFVDISERKKTENELKESEELYRLLAENTLDCIWVMNNDMVFTYVNPAITAILGFTPEEWVGSKLEDHCDKENYQKMMGFVQMGMNDPINFPGIVFQVEVLNKRGEQVPVEIIGKVVADEDGNPAVLQGTTRDITSRVLAKKALKESEEQLRLAMAVSEHGFWDWNLENNEFYFSPKSYSMLGYDDNEFSMSPEKWGELMHPDDRNTILPDIISSIEKKEGFNFELRMISKSGNYRWIQAKGATFSSKEGSIRAIGTLVDINERKKTEEQMLLARIAAEEANRCKDELLANMNHELRTPLNSVIGYAEVMLEQNEEPLSSEHIRYLGIIDNAGHKLLGLINNVLNLAQVESDGIGLKFTTFESAETIETVVSDTKRLALKKKISVNVSIDENVSDVTADAKKFKEILYNLMENALKFTPENGTITIKASVKNDEIIVSVEDTGIGIEDKDKERIFDPFVQVDGSNTRRYGGAGLGLVLVKEYLKMHNGVIWVESEPGKGSKFTFKVPVYPKERAQIPIYDRI